MPPLSLLTVGLDRELALRCLSELKVAGFNPVGDIAQSMTEAVASLAHGGYGVVLIAASLAAGDEASRFQEALRETPAILIGPLPPDRAAGGYVNDPLGAYDTISPNELSRLPGAVKHVLEVQTLRAEAQIAGQRYQELFDLSLAGVFMASLDGRIVDLNTACLHMFGYRNKAEAVGRSLRDMMAEEGAYEHLAHPLLADGSVSGVELMFRRADGERLWALANARLEHSNTKPESGPLIEGTLIDITEKKRAEDLVLQAEKRFKALVENSSDAISLVDATGKVILSSHAVSPIFGYALEERVGKNVFELIHPDDQEHVARLFGTLLQNPSGSATAQVRYRHKNGSWRWIEALGTNMLGDPNVRAVVINYRDITERRLLLQQLFQAQKMEAVGQLAGGVAHDFNNLLTAILGYSDMAMEKLPPHSAARRYTAEIKKAGERAASLTRQLLAFSRLQVMAPQVIDLNAVVTDLSKMLRRLIGEEVQLVIIPGANLSHIKVDPTQMEQVIMNLAVNARDAMPGGGKLIIETGNVSLAETVTAEGVRVKSGDYVLMEVSDTGTGMDNHVKAHLFDPFFTTKEKGKGTGLGLSTVYGIVKQSGGYIWVSSELGQGTAFKIYLPAVEESLSAPKPQATQEHKNMGTETVLVVEDEDAVRVLLGKLLRNMGYHVLEAELAQDALDLAKKYRKTIHLTLTDIAMPRMNGQELARQVKDLHPETRILFMTGYAGNKVGSTSVLDQNANFIHKPFTADALGQKIRHILDNSIC